MMNRDLDGRVELTKRLDAHVDAGDHASTLCQHNPVDSPAAIDGPSRRDVAATNIFGQRAPDEIAIVIDSERFERHSHTREMLPISQGLCGNIKGGAPWLVPASGPQRT